MSCDVRCYEVKILTDDGTIRVGWASPYLAADQKLGTDENAFCFDGYLVGYSTFHLKHTSLVVLL